MHLRILKALVASWTILGMALVAALPAGAQDPVSDTPNATAAVDQDMDTPATPEKTGKSDVHDISFDDITFEMEKGASFEKSMLTEGILALNKEEIRIRGFIRPSFKQTGITKFIFVRDNQECCFGPGAALYDCILVELAEGVETEYTLRPITIKGTFFLKSYKGPDGNIWAIYRMKDAVVE